MKHLLCMILIAQLLACQSTVKENTDAATDIFTCPEARPQICTMIYDPVCAQHQDGTQSTESSNCTACGKPEVVSYRMGTCQ